MSNTTIVLENAALNEELAKLASIVTEEMILEMREKYSGLTIAGPDDKEGYDAVKSAQQIVKKPRLEIEAARKEMKKDVLSYGKAIDSTAKTLTAPFLEIEEYLKAERQRIDDIRAEELSRQRIEKEIADCWDEAHAANAQFDRDREEKAQLEAQRIEQERREAELAAKEAEVNRKEREAKIAEEAAAKAAQAERERIAAEQKAKEEAEAQARREAEEAAKRKPDAEKLKRYFQALLSVEAPEIADDKISGLLLNVQHGLAKLITDNSPEA